MYVCGNGVNLRRNGQADDTHFQTFLCEYDQLLLIANRKESVFRWHWKREGDRLCMLRDME